MKLKTIVLAGRDNCIQRNIQNHCDQLYAADCITDLADLTESVNPDLVVLDSTVAENNICDFLYWSKQQEMLNPIVVASNEEKPSTYFIELGAFDCIPKESTEQDLCNLISKIKDSKSDSQDSLPNPDNSDLGIVGKSEAYQKAIRMIKIVAKSNCNPVLIIGETGTGKELAAKGVHKVRHGGNKPFVAVNCAALTANLLESELFGHVKGAFTSAEKDKAGLLEMAGNGSIFLDEISEMPMELQAKLLRVIQEKTFRKVGGIKDIKCEATIIASSNRNLLNEVENNNFRRDLYYRLSVCPITLSPLRTAQREADIEVLANYFIRTSDICPEKSQKIKGLTSLALKALRQHNWPGNVRELKNVIDRAVLMENSDKIGLSNLMLNPESVMDEPQANVTRVTQCFSLEKAEKELISRALEETNWQKTKAAAMLGITRTTL